ncbi:MAG: peptidase M16 [Acidimicrobiales bacterium]|nr:MAG: peptidase M16 [Acidimicrobiales bacterium]
MVRDTAKAVPPNRRPAVGGYDPHVTSPLAVQPLPPLLSGPLPTTAYRIERFTLGNGLKVVLSPDGSAPVIGVVVSYNVGMRSEPQGRTGFAHLFEHLMFQGSQNLAKLEHFRYVQSSGGVFNGSTHVDYTNYYETLPSNALERTLFLEADRMRAPLITPENLANQIAVVKEEIRLQVQNQPYGGFPWCFLPAVMFDTFANSHDGYGSFADLDAATVADAESFFHAYYAPANAVLAVAGDFDPVRARELVERHFGDIPARSAPTLPNFDEPDLRAPRRVRHQDRLAPMPAVALAWRVPDPVEKFSDYLTYVLLAEVLTDGDASRLVERLLLRDGIATSIGGYVGLMAEAFASRGPTQLILEAHYPSDVSTDTVIDTIDAELARLAGDGIASAELDRVRTRVAAGLLKGCDATLGRTLLLAALEQHHGRAELINELSGLLAQITPEQIQAAAATLHPQRRAVLELVPSGAADPTATAEQPQPESELS